MAKEKEGRLLWIDLEMSGLNPRVERILEIAMVVTDAELEIVAQAGPLVLSQPDELLANMDGWNQKHHNASGLVNAVKESRLSEQEAEDKMLAFVSEHAELGKAPMCGNSVHLDRYFLRRYMPKLENYFHYRNVDVSTLKELAMRWNPQLAAQAKGKTSTHRALEDIMDSIEELKFYRKNFIIS